MQLHSFQKKAFQNKHESKRELDPSFISTSFLPISFSSGYLATGVTSTALTLTPEKSKVFSTALEDTSAAAVLVLQKREQLIIERCNNAAKKAGIKKGITLALAKALCPELNAYPFAPKEDFLSLYRLAQWGLKISPYSGIDSTLLFHVKNNSLETASEHCWGLVLDLTGTKGIHKDFFTLAQKLYSRMRKAHIHSRIAIAPTIGAAWALSRYAKEAISFCESQAEEQYSLKSQAILPVVSELPVQSLRISESTTHNLEELGIQTISELLTIPAKTIGTRFGYIVLKRVDELLGRTDEPFISVHEFEKLAVRRVYETPLHTHEVALEATLRVLNTLLDKINSLNKKASSFLVRFETRTLRGERSYQEKEISLLTASQDTAFVRTIIHSCVETLSFPGGISAIEIEAKSPAYRNVSQIDFTCSADSETRKRAAEILLNTISAHLGSKRIMQTMLLNSYIPESSYSFTPFVSNSSSEQNAVVLSYISASRPTKILHPPEPATVIAMLPDKPPSRISWQGMTQRIVYGIGPERISPEWWRKELLEDVTEERDYFRIQQEDGSWLWIFRTLPEHAWFVQGQW